jgi:hypothetical protein
MNPDSSAEAAPTHSSDAAAMGAVAAGTAQSDAPAHQTRTPRLQPAGVGEYTNTSKPYDVMLRPFHRIHSPHYDPSADDRGAPVLHPPLGDARASGARGPEDFIHTGLTGQGADLVIGVLQGGLIALLGAVFPPAAAAVATIIAASKMIPEDSDLNLLKKANKKLSALLAQTFEGALFDRYMRALPAWVPVGRIDYHRDLFSYPSAEHGKRAASREEEREIEGTVTASFQSCTEVPHTQWTKFYHWVFHVRPLPGYRKLIGDGNVLTGPEKSYIDAPYKEHSYSMERAVDIYGQISQSPQNPEPLQDGDRGSLECIVDVGAFSQPPADRVKDREGNWLPGCHGVMLEDGWPQWPMAGDHFWASGRWVYDCQRVGFRTDDEDDTEELFPTQLNPCKALAVGRYEGFRFPENPAEVRCVRFFFFATSEGGYFNFRDEMDREDTVHEAPITLRDRDYQFIVDLPPHPGSNIGPHPIGGTTEFMRNTLVLRPRLLMRIAYAPFGGAHKKFRWIKDIDFPPLQPRVELLRNQVPGRLPQQALVTIPLTQLPLPPGRRTPQAYSFDLRLGWHDPDGLDRKELTKVRIRFDRVAFEQDHDHVRLKMAVHGRWNIVKLNARERTEHPPAMRRNPDGSVDHTWQPPPLHEVVMTLPLEGRLLIHASGTIRHGFGEYIETTPLRTRELRVGGIIAVKKELQDRLKELFEQGMSRSKEAQLLRKEIERLDEMMKVLDEFLGQPYTPDWLLDIDAQREQGEKERHRVSAIARELWVRPVPVLTRHDEIVGWAEVLFPLVPGSPMRNRKPAQPDGRPHPDDNDRHDWGVHIGTVERLLRYIKRTKPPRPRVPHGELRPNERELEFYVNWLRQVGAGGNVAQQIRPFTGIFSDTHAQQYRLWVRVEAPASD